MQVAERWSPIELRLGNRLIEDDHDGESISTHFHLGQGFTLCYLGLKEFGNYDPESTSLFAVFLIRLSMF